MNDWVCLSPEYRAKIEGDQPLPMEVPVGNPGLDLIEDKGEAEEGKDDEDVPAELARRLLLVKNSQLYHRDTLFLRDR